MKTIWRVISIVAVANLVAMGGLAGYLWASDRLDMQRLREVRELLTPTRAEQRAAQAQAEARARAEQQAAEEQTRRGTPPAAAGEALQLKLRLSRLDEARLETLRRDVRLLQETLRRQYDDLQRERARLAQERQEFERAREVVMRAEGHAQFRKTLATYEGLKPAAARSALQQLIAAGQTDQVVAYLNAMQERTRTRIIDEFLREDPKVAADLLERLRMRGLLAGSADAPGPQSAPRSGPGG